MILERLFVFFSLFPWVSFGILDMDMQPYSIIFGCLIIIKNYKSISDYRLFYALLISISSIFIALAYGYMDFLTLRAVASYSAIFIISSAFLSLKMKKIEFLNSLYYSSLIWCLASIIQVAFGNDSLSFLVHTRTSLDRGVTSLAPEPTFYGIYLVFISWLILKSNNYDIKNISKLGKVVLLVNFLSIFIFSKSSMSILFLVIVLILYFSFSYLKKIKLTTMSILVVSLLSTYYLIDLIEYSYPESRVSKIISRLSEYGVSDLVYTDASINQRVKNVVLSIHGALDTYFIPNGYHEFSTKSEQLNYDYGGFFWWGESSNIILSGIGSAMFELGIMSIFVVMYIYSFSSGNKLKTFNFISIFIIMFSAIPLSFPLFSILCTTNSHEKNN